MRRIERRDDRKGTAREERMLFRRDRDPTRAIGARGEGEPRTFDKGATGRNRA
jgi:hypothetical protein